MDRIEFFFALLGLSAGALYAGSSQPEALAKTIVGGFFVVALVGLVSMWIVLHRIKTDHPSLNNEIGATFDDLGLGFGDANRRFRKFLRSSRHRELDDRFLFVVVVLVRVTWRLNYCCAGFMLYFALSSLSK